MLRLVFPASAPIWATRRTKSSFSQLPSQITSENSQRSSLQVSLRSDPIYVFLLRCKVLISVPSFTDANEIRLKQEELSLAAIKQFFLDCDSDYARYDVLVELYSLLTSKRLLYIQHVARADDSLL